MTIQMPFQKRTCRQQWKLITNTLIKMHKYNNTQSPRAFSRRRTGKREITSRPSRVICWLDEPPLQQHGLREGIMWSLLAKYKIILDLMMKTKLGFWAQVYKIIYTHLRTHVHKCLCILIVSRSAELDYYFILYIYIVAACISVCIIIWRKERRRRK